MGINFEYGVTKINKFKVNMTKGLSKNTVNSIVIDDKVEVVPTKRFWKSLHQRFRYNQNIYKYFDHAEIFQRITERASNDSVRWCVEKVDGVEKGRLLAITNPTSPYIQFDDLLEILQKNKAESSSYSEGVIRSTHIPRVPWHFAIKGDEFVNRFVADIPIDGVGKPNVYVSMLRLACTNGLVAYTPAFRTEIATGKKNEGVAFSIKRMLESFNNEEAYHALQNRLESSQNSWASVHEVMNLQKVLVRVHGQGQLKGIGEIKIGKDDEGMSNPVMNAFTKMTGDLNHKYGLANLDSLSTKKQKTLPANCKVYDILNFTTEVATHHSNPTGNRTLQAFVGKLIKDEYDLEGTGEYYNDFSDFFIGNEKVAETVADMQKLAV